MHTEAKIVSNNYLSDLFPNSSELVAELPFTLMHPKPDDSYDRPSSSSGSHKSELSGKENGGAAGASTGAAATGGGSAASPDAAAAAAGGDAQPAVDTNLIQLDT